jgi:hypothetical protein
VRQRTLDDPHGPKRCAITRGVVAHDPRIKALGGLYLWADFCDGRVNGLTPQGKLVPLGLPVPQPTSFGTDGAGASM